MHKTSKQLAIIHSATFTIFFAMSIVVPILGPYLSSLGFSDTEIGIIAMFMPLTSIVLRPLAGFLADTWSRKYLVVLGLLATTLSGLFYIGSNLIVSFGRVFQGIGLALFVPGSTALTSYLAKKTVRLGFHMGIRSLLNGLGFTLGPLASAYLTVNYGFHAPFIALAIVPLPFVYLSIHIDELTHRVLPEIDYVKILKWWLSVGRKPFILWTTISMTLMTVGYTSIQTFLSLYYQATYGKGVVLAGTFFTILGLSSIPTRAAGGILSEKRGPYKIVESALILILVGSTTILVKGFISFIISPIFIGLGLGLLIPSMLVGVSQVTDNKEYGSAFSFSTTYWDTGGLIGPLLGGILSSLSGYWLAILLYPLLNSMAVAAFTIYYISVRNNQVS
ncbi:MAG: MFS transporter [Desulfurococcales archaeon]|nr:MFS transporter [Desulfurococcales archaeon]